ncbi:tropomodulin isoform X2 [Hyalella azteca]|uniref:Tropomodulin isoform X2 n=1 Tax=Hyalella azteca TaxID=294128 RepID=A0A8B7NRF7_HYAAZ|nr:tropomodulin isoform X2 [Hyalella azteca]
MESEEAAEESSYASGRRRSSATAERRGSMFGNRITYAGNEMTSGKLFGKDLTEYDEVDVDALLEQLSPEELELLAGDVDPDDSLVPPSERCGYKCEKESTGPLDRKQLIDHINEQAINEPDRPELVPYVPGTVRGKKWVPPPPPVSEDPDDPTIDQVEVDLDEEFNSVLEIATEDEIVDLAAILGFHSMMNQDQYHASLLNKGRPVGVGWGGITKATKFKPLPAEPPNDTDPEESIKRLKSDDAKFKELNLNNIRKMTDEQLGRLFGALGSNSHLETLSMANTGLSDRHLDALTSALAQNNTLRTLNLETNNITPPGVVRVMEALNKMHSVEEVRLANQQQGVLGNKIEMQLTNLIEENNTLLRVGIHFEFNDARNRVSRQLQKNLDTFRIGLKTRRPRPVVSTEGASLSFTVPARIKQQQLQDSPGIPPEDLDSTLSDSEDGFSSDEGDEVAAA